MTTTMARTVSKPRKPRGERPRWNLNPSFSQWLFTKLESKDESGDVARWVYADMTSDPETKEKIACWSHRWKTLTHMILHLRTEHKGQKNAPTELAMRRVFEEYQRFLADDGKIPARLGGVKPSDLNTHRGFIVPKVTLKQIQELAAKFGLTQGGVIEREIGRAHRIEFGVRK